LAPAAGQGRLLALLLRRWTLFDDLWHEIETVLGPRRDALEAFALVLF
jgi:hypothetical protein